MANLYDAEQNATIKRIGSTMRKAGPITQRKFSAPGESKMCKQIQGGSTGEGKKGKGSY